MLANLLPPSLFLFSPHFVAFTFRNLKLASGAVFSGHSFATLFIQLTKVYLSFKVLNRVSFLAGCGQMELDSSVEQSIW